MEEKLTYKDSGVDVTAGYQAVERMKKHIERTKTQGTIGAIGGFGGMFEIPTGYKQPVLVSGTDGVGTKLQIAFMSGVHNTIGIDCVAMCVNDIICQGAKPLIFLDYIGCGKLEPQRIEQIVQGVADGCVLAGCSLVGGETAEMPGFYKDNEYDLAGFCVGIAEKEKLIRKSNVKNGDILIALPSSGIHSNGFSLVRKLFFQNLKNELSHYYDELSHTLEEELLIPTKIYVNAILPILDTFDIHGISHITGGGLIENIPRMFDDSLTARVSVKSLPEKPIFKLISKLGHVEDMEMYNTFNMGVGFVLAVSKSECDGLMKKLKENSEQPIIIGEIILNTIGEGILFV